MSVVLFTVVSVLPEMNAKALLNPEKASANWLVKAGEYLGKILEITFLFVSLLSHFFPILLRVEFIFEGVALPVSSAIAIPRG